MKKLVLILMGGLMIIQAKSQNLKQAVAYTDNELFETSGQVLYKLIAAKPADAELLYFMGENFYASERLDSASAYYEKGITANPSFALNFVGRGKVALANGQDPSASFAKAKELSGGKNADVLIEIAEAYIVNNKNMPAAFEALNAAEKLDPKNIRIYLMKGDAQLLLDNDGSTAITFYDKAAELEPASPRPNVHIGALYERTINYQQAVEEYQNAIKKDSTYAPAYRQLGFVYYKFKNYEQAQTYMEKYVKMTGNLLSAKVTYAKFLFLAKKYAEAIEKMKEILAVDNSINVLNRLLAYSYFELKNCEQALIYIQKFFETQKTTKNPILAQDYSYYGKILACSGKDSLGLIEYQKAVDMDSMILDNYTDMANSYKKVGKFAEAAGSLARKISLSKEPSINDYFALGQIYYSKGAAATDSVEKYTAFHNADSIFTTVVEKMPAQVIGHVFRARANAGMDPKTTTGLAKPYYEKVIELGVADPVKNKNYLIEAYYYLAYYHYNVSKDKAAAIQNINNVLAIDPNHDQSKKLLDIVNKYMKDVPPAPPK